MKQSTILALLSGAFALSTLTGCTALLFVPAAYVATKTAQGQMKSTVQVQFEKPSVADTNALASVSKLAIWPQSGPGVEGQNLIVDYALLAEDLSARHSLAIITPVSVMQAMQTNATLFAIQSMTTEEKLEAFRRVAEQTGADAVFSATTADFKANTGMFSLKRATTTRTATLSIYSQQKNDFIWQAVVNVEVSVSQRKMLTEAEIRKETMARVADKSLELTGKSAAPKLAVMFDDSKWKLAGCQYALSAARMTLD